VPGEHGAQPGQLAGQVSGGAWAAGLLDLRCPGERGGALPLHLILSGSGELEADKPQCLLRQHPRFGTVRRRQQAAHTRIRVSGWHQASR